MSAQILLQVHGTLEFPAQATPAMSVCIPGPRLAEGADCLLSVWVRHGHAGWCVRTGTEAP